MDSRMSVVCLPLRNLLNAVWVGLELEVGLKYLSRAENNSELMAVWGRAAQHLPSILLGFLQVVWELANRSPSLTDLQIEGNYSPRNFPVETGCILFGFLVLVACLKIQLVACCLRTDPQTEAA